MKVLHLTDGLTDGDGGAIAVNRIHRGLRDAGISSHVLCTTKWPAGASADITRVDSSRFERKATRYLNLVSEKVGLNGLLDPTHFQVVRNKAFLDADVLTIHSIPGLCSYLAIPELTRRKPAVLILHDMMSFTGHCFHSLDCERWKSGCGKCPYPNTPPRITMDNTRLAWKLRDWAFSRADLAVVALNTWMAGLAKQSMLRRFAIHCIPHGIDTEVFRPHDPEFCRATLGIPKGKRVLMFMSVNLDDPLKGGDLFLEAMRSLPESLKRETVLLLLGRRGESLANSLEMQTIYLGYVGSDHLKAICYSAADCLVTPSRAESFGYVLVESIACGTPVVAQEVCGLADIVRPGRTGLLAQPEDVAGFRDQIVELLENEGLRSRMRQECRRIAVEEYSVSLQAERYIELYRDLVKRPPAS